LARWPTSKKKHKGGKAGVEQALMQMEREWVGSRSEEGCGLRSTEFSLTTGPVKAHNWYRKEG